MKKYFLLSIAFLNSICFGQAKAKSVPETDFNTFFVCIDSISYDKLFDSKYLTDTLFFCKEVGQHTNLESYNGKYWIGESATVEFFKPNISNQLGDHLGDWGIEFKTRKIKTLDILIKKAASLKMNTDTATIKTMIDSVAVPWYKSLSFRTIKNELSILEYQAAYLKMLGFNQSEINNPLTYKEYNTILSNGKKYPRQFSMVNYIKLFVDEKSLKDLINFGKLNNCTQHRNKFTNGETTIEYVLINSLPKFPIQEIGISLLKPQKFHIEKISGNILVKTKGKKARILFENFQ